MREKAVVKSVNDFVVYDTRRDAVSSRLPERAPPRPSSAGAPQEASDHTRLSRRTGQNLLTGFVRLRGTCILLSGLHVLIAIHTILKPFYYVRLDNLVWDSLVLRGRGEVYFGVRLLGAS